MGLFDKKYCDICGEKIGLLGNRKLEDGNMCSDCNKLKSPFMTDRRKTTVEEMKKHLEYREQNRDALARFNVSFTYGDNEKVYIDTNAGNFIVTTRNPGNWSEENPDVIPLSQVTGCNTVIDENREEIFSTDSEGNKVSYSPRRFEYDYDFRLSINLSSPWFDEINFRLNNRKVEGINSMLYHNYEVMANNIKTALTNMNMPQQQQYVPQQQQYVPQQQQYVPQQQQNAPQQQYAQPAQNVAPAAAAVSAAVPAQWYCQSCGALNDGKFCTSCGAPK